MKYEDSHMDNRWDRRDRKRRSKKSFVQAIMWNDFFDSEDQSEGGLPAGTE